jgi:hypothetical protein
MDFFPGGDTILALTLSSQKKSLDEKKTKKTWLNLAHGKGQAK